MDIVEHQNFLAASLATLFANISDSSHELPSSLVERASKFRRHLTTRFAWSFDLEGNEEDAPVVVELWSNVIGSKGHALALGKFWSSIKSIKEDAPVVVELWNYLEGKSVVVDL